jgi:two-component system OmpR family sensor kinase
VIGVEHVAAIGWPVALMVAAIVVRDRVRAARRRGALNAAMHELRRPLQALLLKGDSGRANGAGSNGVPGELELAVAALDELDREINGEAPPLRVRPLPARVWVEGSLARWQTAAGRLGSPVALRWHAGGASVLADPNRLAQALDNLIVNALEHGGPPIRVHGAIRGERLRIVVADGGPGSPRDRGPRPPTRLRVLARRRATRGRRGNGLRAVARIASEHGGRFMVEPGRRGTVAALELPLAATPATAAVAA